MTIQPRLDVDQLVELLAEQHEHEGLDYKSQLDLSALRDRIELSKDIGAMSAEGGYIVVGASDSGEAMGIAAERATRDYDESRLRGQIRRYLPDIDIRAAVHAVDGRTLALIWVGQHPLGFSIFAIDGQFQDGARPVTVFREGDVFIRRGSSSVRAGHIDMQRLRERFIERERTRVRREWAADLAESRAPVATRPSISWDEELAEFHRVAVDLVRAGETVPVRLLMAGVRPHALAAAGMDATDEFDAILDRLACLCALGIVLDSDWLFDESVSGLQGAYEVGHERLGQPTPGLDGPVVWLAVVVRIFALGGLAVRTERWPSVRNLALIPGEGEGSESLHRTWLRHAQTWGARTNLLGDREEDQRGKVILLARDAANRLACVRPDQPEGDGSILTSICQFDAAAGLATIAAGPRMANVYPSFGRCGEAVTEPLFARVIGDQALRSSLQLDDDQLLADALRYLNNSATHQFWWNWTGFDDQRIHEFLESHPAEHD